VLLGAAALLFLMPRQAEAQFERNWLSVGSLHNWYSAGGAEVEHGLVSQQQYGLRWPGLYRLRDSQAAKGIWLGARNVQDPSGRSFPVRVVHVGPRVRGEGVVFPVAFETISRFEPTEVTVDGAPSEADSHGAVTRVDPNLIADRMIYHRTNTLLGVTMERRIFQFSQEYHDAYHVIEYTFTNTGITDGTDQVRLPNHTVEDFVVFLQWRWSVAAESRYVIGNSSGWGVQTMIDRRGDGLRDDPEDEQFRAQFAWHGHYPAFTHYSPVGGPILPMALPAFNIAANDTLGRLGASQFVGALTLHADRSPNDPTNDPSQPSTLNYFDSDSRVLRGNDPFADAQMAEEYALMTQGIQSPRHAFLIEPSGDPGFVNPSASPAAGTQGHSAGNGYGPYTLRPGESVRIVLVEASNGLSKEANDDIGRQYYLAGPNRDQAQLSYEVGGQVHQMTKNEWVLTSRDSLFQTFRRAKANFEADWGIPQPPPPPTFFSVSSRGGWIEMEWDSPTNPDRWEIYRARNRVDSTYVLVADLPGSARSFDDETPTRGLNYFYYIQAVRDAPHDGTGLTPPGPLRSSRYLAQTYQAARLLRPPGPTPSRAVYDLPVTLDAGTAQPGEVRAGENALDVIYASELGGEPRGFQLVTARIDVTRCLAWETVDGEEVCQATRIDEYHGVGSLHDMRETPVGTVHTVTWDLDALNNAISARLHVGFLGVNFADELQLRFNDQSLEVTEDLVGPLRPLHAIRVVPNPFHLRADQALAWGGDRIGFLNVPGFATIQIFSELGELIETLQHDDGSGDAYWNLTTSSGQLIVSGVYIAVITDQETRERIYRKFVVVR
jgi:hypothetical protein